MKIFLIEDNPVQIKWAKEQLSGYELVIATNTDDGWEVLKKAKKSDIVICDLELPAFGPEGPYRRIDRCTDDGWIVEKIPVDEPNEPTMKNGFNFFESAVLPRLVGGKVKGIALLSDFEHHAASRDDNENFERFEKLIGIIEVVSKFKKSEFGSARGLNIVCIVDRSAGSYRGQAMFWFHGERLTRAEVGERFAPSTRGDLNADLKDWRAQGGVILKPYKEAVDLLLG